MALQYVDFGPTPETHRLRMSPQFVQFLKENYANGKALDFAFDNFRFGDERRVRVPTLRFYPSNDELCRMCGGFYPLLDETFPRKVVRKDWPIIQLDRFAEYEASDMDWAEPAGLAKWQCEEVHYHFEKKSDRDIMFAMQMDRESEIHVLDYPHVSFLTFPI